jgi:hypothetical protein
MGPVHLYLAAWVAGGVLLGASMLLDGRETAPEGGEHDPEPGADPYALREGELATAPRHVPFYTRLLRVAPLGLIGFGLCGLTAKGFDIDLWPWTLVCALGVGLSLIAVGYGMSAHPSSD